MARASGFLLVRKRGDGVGQVNAVVCGSFPGRNVVPRPCQRSWLRPDSRARDGLALRVCGDQSSSMLFSTDCSIRVWVSKLAVRSSSSACRESSSACWRAALPRLLRSGNSTMRAIFKAPIIAPRCHPCHRRDRGGNINLPAVLHGRGRFPNAQRSRCHAGFVQGCRTLRRHTAFRRDEHQHRLAHGNLQGAA